MTIKGVSPLSTNKATKHLDRAFTLDEENEYQRALNECDKAIQIDPTLSDAHNLRGVILEELGMKDDAVLAYREAVRLDSNFKEAKENLRDIEFEQKVDRFKSLQIEGKSFGIRGVAYMIDSVIWIALTILISSIVGFGTGIMILITTGQEFQYQEQTNQILNYLIELILFTLYFTIFEWLYGATLGKIIIGSRVIMENGERCTLVAALIRAGIRYIDGLFFGIPAYASMKSPLFQRFGDKTAKTVVVGAKESIIKQPRAWWWFLVAAMIVSILIFIDALYQIITNIRWGISV